MSKRKAKPAPAPRKRAGARAPTRASAAKAARSEAEVKPAGVEVDGATTVRHYGNGTSSTITHATEDAAREYAASCRGA